MSKKDNNEFPINETGFPYNPQFSTGTTPLPTLRPIAKRKPDITVIDYNKYYVPGNEPICPFANYNDYHNKHLREMYAEQHAEEQAQQQQMAAQANANQDGEGDDDED